MWLKTRCKESSKFSTSQLLRYDVFSFSFCLCELYACVYLCLCVSYSLSLALSHTLSLHYPHNTHTHTHTHTTHTRALKRSSFTMQYPLRLRIAPTQRTALRLKQLRPSSQNVCAIYIMRAMKCTFFLLPFFLAPLSLLLVFFSTTTVKPMFAKTLNTALQNPSDRLVLDQLEIAAMGAWQLWFN